MARDTPDADVLARSAPLTVVMITFNEAHNMPAVLDNLRGFAREVVVVDSYSTDATVDLALAGGARVVQRRFRGFGDQWNFAVGGLSLGQPWTMKLDPDERLTDRLKSSIRAAIAAGAADGLVVRRRLWFMGRPLPVRQNLLRAWRTGSCRFTDVLVNEQPSVAGAWARLQGDLEHHDSPDLHAWFDKQNGYTTSEALQLFHGAGPPARAFGGGPTQRRAWLKRLFYRAPLRAEAMGLYCLLVQGAWRAGRVGFIWARLRSDLYRQVDFKLREMRLRGAPPPRPERPRGCPRPDIQQFD
ncbi:MAG TPA: glycosyltransferase family 2 protein [Caulobacteraceae bacterium]|jgi:hypothetical protein|nr:glycosyltransferase family 2 protein [Caulobacteraceae bacterium]